MFRRRTVPVRHEGLLYVRGAYSRTLGPGRHRLPRGADLVEVDLREQHLPLSPQEVLTADGLSVRVTAVVRCAVVDARAFHENHQDPLGVVYLAAQVALREELGAVGVEDLARRGATLPVEALTAAAARAGALVGVEVREVVVKDVILPGELRAAAVEVATAKARGLAQLETARAETAALRSMANAAQLLEDHPALARLRTVQSAGAGGQVVVHVHDGATPTVEG